MIETLDVQDGQYSTKIFYTPFVAFWKVINDIERVI